MLTFRKGLSLPDAAKEIVTTYKDTLPATFKWRGTKFTVEVGNTVEEIIDHVRRARAQAAVKKRKGKAPADPLHLPGVPAPVREAIGAYAYHYYMQDRGCGSEVGNAEVAWLEARRTLLAWAKRKTKAKRVVFMHAHRPNP